MATQPTAPNLVSIKIVRGSELSEAIRAKYGINNDDFAEIRVERNSPAKPKIVKLNTSPAMKFSESLKSAGFKESDFT